MWPRDGAGMDTFEAQAAWSSGDASERPSPWALANRARLGDGRDMFADRRRIAVAFCAIGNSSHWQFSAFVGRISFSVYLMHAYVLSVIVYLFGAEIGRAHV